MSPAVVQPDGWPRPVGYSNGVAAQGRIVAVAGQVGWDPRTERVVSDDFAEQAAQALRNVLTVAKTAGARPEDVVRLTWYVTSRDEYAAARERLGSAYRESFGRWFPAMSVVVVAGLVEDGAKVEIEATCVLED